MLKCALYQWAYFSQLQKYDIGIIWALVFCGSIFDFFFWFFFQMVGFVDGQWVTVFESGPHQMTFSENALCNNRSIKEKGELQALRFHAQKPLIFLLQLHYLKLIIQRLITVWQFKISKLVKTRENVQEITFCGHLELPR